MDALKYAPGPVICRVELGGRIVHEGHYRRPCDKCVASERTVIAMTDATSILHEFACWAAERALNRIDNPDPRSVEAIQAKRKWMRGEITDAELAAAWAAAWDAAGDAAWTAAWTAAWAAARDAARAAARTASASDAARGAARDAERKAQSRKLTSMVKAAL